MAMDLPQQSLKSKLSSRKLIIFGILFVIATVALFTDFADFSKWAEFVKWLFGIYAGSNAIVHASRAQAIGKINGNGGSNGGN